MEKGDSDYLRQHWPSLLESLDDGLIVVTQEGRIEFMNQAAAQLLGFSSELARGRAYAPMLAANPWLVELLDVARSSQSRNVCAEATLFPPAPGTGVRPRPVRAAAAPLFDTAGAGIGALVTLHDLSYQRELESRTREAERLEQLEILLAGLAHEIKNPLSGVRGAAQLLTASDADETRTRECTRIILGEIDRLSALLAELLDLTGPCRLERTSVNIHEVLERVLAIESRGRGAALRFVRRFDPSLPAVHGDAARLTQVLLNLIRNAVEVSPPDGAVTLTTRIETTYVLGGARKRSQYLSIEIADEGPGIGAEDLERIFSPFFTTKNGGTGLGLAISQRIVAEHEGALRVSNAPERGAVFTVTLPVARGFDP